MTTAIENYLVFASLWMYVDDFWKCRYSDNKSREHDIYGLLRLQEVFREDNISYADFESTSHVRFFQQEQIEHLIILTSL